MERNPLSQYKPPEEEEDISMQNATWQSLQSSRTSCDSATREKEREKDTLSEEQLLVQVLQQDEDELLAKHLQEQEGSAQDTMEEQRDTRRPRFLYSDGPRSSLLRNVPPKLSHDEDELFAKRLQMEEALGFNNEIQETPSIHRTGNPTSMLHPLFNVFYQPRQAQPGIRYPVSSYFGYDDEEDMDDHYDGDIHDAIDPDQMSYEELLALGERIGNVNCGASSMDITACPESRFDTTTKQDKNCLICLEEFQKGNTLRTLPCFHSYHTQCIDAWLAQKPTCPVCQCPIK